MKNKKLSSVEDEGGEVEEEEEILEPAASALCESCENGVWSGQLWQINSPPIYNKN